MTLSRRGFLALVTGLAAAAGLPMPLTQADPVRFEEVDPTTVDLRYDADGLVEVVERRDHDYSAFKIEDVPAFDHWGADHLALMESRVRERKEYTRLLGEAITEWVTIERGLRTLGWVERLPVGALIVHHAVDDGERLYSAVEVTPEQFARLGKVVQAGGGFWLAELGDWRWVIARNAYSLDGRRVGTWRMTEEANKLGVGLIPAAIKLRTMASDMERWAASGREIKIQGGVTWP